MQSQIISIWGTHQFQTFHTSFTLQNPVLGLIGHQLAFPIQVTLSLPSSIIHTEFFLHWYFYRIFSYIPSHRCLQCLAYNWGPPNVCRMKEWMNKWITDPKPSHSSRPCQSAHFPGTIFYKLWPTAFTPWPDLHCTQLHSLPLNTSLALSSRCFECANLIPLTWLQFSLRLRPTAVLQLSHSLQHPVQHWALGGLPEGLSEWKWIRPPTVIPSPVVQVTPTAALATETAPAKFTASAGDYNPAPRVRKHPSP